MTHDPEAPATPPTPLRILARGADIPEGPFFVRAEPLVEAAEMREPSDEEIDALARIIFNAYSEWRSQ